MGVCIEPPQRVIGMKPFEQWTFRTQPEGHPSGPGDLDLSVYSLRKFVSLALAGNPSIMILLFVPKQYLSIATPLGLELQAKAPLIVSRSAGYKFLGYLKSQRERLTGERGGRALRKNDNPAGYDTKYAMHMTRLAYQGIELLTTGYITLPMPEPERSYIMQVRRGEVALEDAMTLVTYLESELEELLHTSPLTEKPDKEAMDRWLVEAYFKWWGINAG